MEKIIADGREVELSKIAARVSDYTIHNGMIWRGHVDGLQHARGALPAGCPSPPEVMVPAAMDGADHTHMRKEIIPIGELKIRLMGWAAAGYRINHGGSCLFSGFALNQNWTARGPVLKERLERLVVEGAKFEVQFDADEPGNPAISRWTTVCELTAGPEVEP